MQSRGKNARRPEFKQITMESLKATYDKAKLDYPYPGDRTQAIANAIAMHWLGKPWVKKYIDSASRDAAYLRIDLKSPLQEKATALMRYWEFAESLLNLQSVDGFEAVLDELSYGKIESACAEIDVGRLIFLHQFRFRFVKPTRGTKLDYDFEVFYSDGLKVCADAKCKLETTRLRAESIVDSLRTARKQLPDDEPSVILVKVPEKWISDKNLANQIVDAARDYLRQSSHIRSVKFYAPVTVFTHETTMRLHAFKEVSNPKFPERNWDMFRDNISPPGGMPSCWTRIYPELKIAE